MLSWLELKVLEPFFASNVSPTSQKNVDTHKKVNEYIENVIVKTVFFECAKNYSNILTKNVIEELHEKNSTTLTVEKSDLFSRTWNI